METKVSIANGSNERLIGLETIPSIAKEKYPTVILVHGFAVTKEECGLFDEMAVCLSNAGFAVYRFDFSGCGESQGDYTDTSVSKLKSDLSSILNFVKAQPKVDNSRIGILAQSFGTSVTIALSPRVKALVLTGSLANVKDLIGDLTKWKPFNEDGISKRVRSDGSEIIIKPQFWKDFRKYDFVASIKNITCPILFIHGSKDHRAPLSGMESLFEAANRPKEKMLIKGAEHSLEPHREKVYKIVVEWFKKYLA